MDDATVMVWNSELVCTITVCVVESVIPTVEGDSERHNEALSDPVQETSGYVVAGSVGNVVSGTGGV